MLVAVVQAPQPIYRSRRARSKTNSLDGRQGKTPRYQFKQKIFIGQDGFKKGYERWKTGQA